MQAHTSTANDARATLPRRFTTNTVPTLPTISPLSPIGQQRRQAAESVDFTSATFHKVQMLEKKKNDLEALKEQRARFDAEMESYEKPFKGTQIDYSRFGDEINRTNLPAPQSEPTTPPEYRDNGFPTAFSRPQRYSVQSFTSPQSGTTLSNRPSRSGSQITSPPHVSHGISHMPSKSMPGSRRGSDEEEDSHELSIANMNPRTGAALNRNSVPVTGLDLRQRIHADNSTGLPDLKSVLGHMDFFGDDDQLRNGRDHNPAASPDVKSYLQMNTTDDKFPILVRRDGDGSMRLSASSAALDLALSPGEPGPEVPTTANDWQPTRSRHVAQHSMPANNLHKSDEFDFGNNISDGRTNLSNRHSTEVRFTGFGDQKRPGLLSSPPASNGMPKLSSSYSTNDIPTMKNANGLGTSNSNTGINTHAENHFHKHNASMGRIPATALHSRDVSASENQMQDQHQSFRSPRSSLHASAAPFGPNHNNNNNALMPASTAAVGQYGNQPLGGQPSYGQMPMPNLNGINGLNMTGMNAMNGLASMNGMLSSPYANAYGQYSQYTAPAPQPRYPDSQARVIQQRRMQNHQDHLRSQTNYNFDSLLPHDIVELCKDQHGCRYLQKQIEGRNLDVVRKIFDATKEHVVDLMQDPFANYLCQKMLEFCNDEQRTRLIINAAPQMVSIALNQHGTRALQKMIEYVSTRDQINTIIAALCQNVVTLIQDLNGNHVIQKCLNHLGSEDAAFIFHAVGDACVIVGTHRHGCCVLQRCIDHSSGHQRNTLIAQITGNAISLVQDPFGNYVVQYILDLQEEGFTVPLCQSFRGRVCQLSKQKFSSNVMEKCIRVSNAESKRALIEELLQVGELERLIRDSYGNYVVQTALDYSDAPTKVRLVEACRPMLPSIRSTPYGRRIATKVHEFDGRMSGSSSGNITPIATGAPNQLAYPATMALGSTQPMNGQPFNNMSNGFGSNLASPQPHRLTNAAVPNNLQAAVQQTFSYNRGINGGMNGGPNGGVNGVNNGVNGNVNGGY
ncbi:armadillo-type protein [Phyllosticta citribraziliensis]